jgi:hypothetical protein
LHPQILNHLIAIEEKIVGRLAWLDASPLFAGILSSIAVFFFFLDFFFRYPFFNV